MAYRIQPSTTKLHSVQGFPLLKICRRFSQVINDALLTVVVAQRRMRWKLMWQVGKELARCVRTTFKNATSVSSVKSGEVKRNTSMRMAVNVLEIRRGYLPSVQNMLCTKLLFHTLLFWYQQLTAFCYFDSKGQAIITAPMSPMWLHQALKRNEIHPNYFRPWNMWNLLNIWIAF